MSHFFIPKARAVQALVADLLDDYAAIRLEALAMAEQNRFGAWIEPNYTGTWAVHGFRWQGHTIDSPARTTAAVLGRHEALVQNAAFSLLAPGAQIAPHQGYTTDVLRLHFGLLCPLGPGCELVVEGEHRQWVDGEVFCFDDTLEHSAHNRTPDLRIVLIIDLSRSVYERDEIK